MGAPYNTQRKWDSYFQAAIAGAMTPTSTPKLKSNGEKIVEVAQKYLGTPYIWGGKSKSTGGVDCSGLIYNVLKDSGFDVGVQRARDYYSSKNFGTPVSKESLQPGDIVFFGSDGVATHTGIYVGNGNMIHSSGGSANTASNPGKGVEYKRVDSRPDFLGAKRF